MIAVADAAELGEAVAGGPPGRRVLPVAGASKPPLTRAGAREDVELLDVSALSGVLEYDPAELTLTAQAATPLREVVELLARNGQHLPFDPPLAAAGATLGGTVAAGISGPGALRHGTVRDFVIGVRFVDGTGTLVGGGGKVVKNAAGFDLPKLLVGSLGRLGVMTQLSFKVLPRPRATTTLELACDDVASAVATACACAAGARELDAVDVLPDARVLIRLGGEPDALPARARRISADALLHADDAALWDAARELRWAPDRATVLRVPTTGRTAAALAGAVTDAGGTARVSLAANATWLAWPEGADPADLDALLRARGATGLAVAGPATGPVLGAPTSNPFGARVRAAFDPHDRFLEV